MFSCTRLAASGSVDRTVKIWDVASQVAVHTLTGHTNSVTSVAFSLDGSSLLSASDDKTMILWDVATGNKLHTFTGHDDIITQAAFGPDGTMALSGSEDNTLILWHIPTFPDGFRTWIETNRYVPDLACDMRTTYHLEPCATQEP